MKKVRLFHNLTMYAWKELCQQFWLLAVLSMLFLALPLAAGPVAGELLSQGVAFTGLKFAVCAPQGDSTGELVERLTAGMKDVRSYASFESMEENEALEALEAGEVTAVLLLPEQFVDGILEGSNPDVVLIVSGEKPLEAALAYWVGQSAADLLTAAQQGIYTVLELYPGSGSVLSWPEVVTGINMKFINLALNRQALFNQEQLEAGDRMDLVTHYGLSLLLFLLLCLPPVYLSLFDRQKLDFLRRLAALGHGAGIQFGSRLWVCCWSAFVLLVLPAGLLTQWNLAGAAVAAVFVGCWASFCCTAASTAGGCAGMSFLGAAGMLLCCGGLLPTQLLPAPIRGIGSVLPFGMLRQLLYLPVSQWDQVPWELAGALLWIAGLMAMSSLLYSRQLKGGRK